MKRVFIFIAILSLCINAFAEHVRVSLFSNSRISTLNVSFDLGQYNLYVDDDNLLEDKIGEGRSVLVQSDGTQLHVQVNEDDYGYYSKVRLVAQDTACIMCLNPNGFKQRTYEGNLEIRNREGKLQIINDVEFETYIAGVVQSEIYGNRSDIFRVQAIISRTWAMRNINKHKNNGYNFCDNVHCQAYMNRCIRPDIMMGALQSWGETIVDKSGNLIETPFHSNSGGQTANSEDVWRAALPYLRSVDDTFSYRMKQSNWTKTISMDRWLGYFQKTHKIDIDDSLKLYTLLHFTQDRRQAKLLDIPLTRIRSDFQLKSTFFSVTTDSITKSVTLHGRGYGHGVGLSQEGLIRMVELGFSYDSIIRHYYTGAILHSDPISNPQIVINYTEQLGRIIEEDKNKQTQIRSKKDDWLGRLFRVRDREEREEIYVEEQQDNEQDWNYEW